jgi:hypothetical protein
MRLVLISRRVSFLQKLDMEEELLMQVLATPTSDSAPSGTSASRQASHRWIWTLGELAQAAGQFR